MSMSGIKMPEDIKKKIVIVRAGDNVTKKIDMGAIFFFLDTSKKPETITEAEPHLPRNFKLIHLFKRIKQQKEGTWCFVNVPVHFTGFDSPSPVFIHWAPESMTTRKKMVMASTKATVQKCCDCKVNWQITDPEELNKQNLLEKIAEKSNHPVKDIESICNRNVDEDDTDSDDDN